MYEFKWTLRLRIIGSPFCARVECEMIPILILLFVNLPANFILFCMYYKAQRKPRCLSVFSKLMIEKHKAAPKHVKKVSTNEFCVYFKLISSPERLVLLNCVNK